ncbi:TDA10 Probable ATP-dependent kinase TDA10 [Candida maltosa Xu316]
MDTTFEITTKAIDERIANHSFTDKPLIIGLNGPQGSGKSYLTNQLTEYLTSKYSKLTTIQISMDDFYLTKSDQDKITETTDNPLLKGRGLPGTHDLKLLYSTFKSIVGNYKDKTIPHGLKIPKYDKSAYNGLGDRCAEYTVIDKPIDIVIFEGWFNGYVSIDSTIVRLNYLNSEIDGLLQSYKMYNIEEINDNLVAYQELWTFFDLFIILHSDDVNNVYTWRLQQEHSLIQLTNCGMTDDEVRKFVDRYMPAYLLYYDNLCTNGLSNCDNLIVSIDLSRNVTDVRHIK